MKILHILFFAAAVLFSGQAAALPDGHPADPAAATLAFQPADYFSGKPMQLAAAGHEHDGVAASAREESEGQGCKREGKGCCCCCKCCDKGGDEKEDMKCMKKSGGEHRQDSREGCGMKKDAGMQGKDEGKAGTSDAHEGHH